MFNKGQEELKEKMFGKELDICVNYTQRVWALRNRPSQGNSV